MSKQTENVPDGQVVLLPEHLRLYGLTPKKVARLMEEGGFPPAIRLSLRSRGWLKKDVEAWLAAQPTGVKPCVGFGQFTPERIEEQQRRRAGRPRPNSGATARTGIRGS